MSQEFDMSRLPEDAYEPLKGQNIAERERVAAPSLSFAQDSWRRLKKNKAAVLSLILLIVIAAIAILSIWVSPHDPALADARYTNLPPRIPGIFDGTRDGIDLYKEAGVPGQVNFYFGTDDLGRDVFSRLLQGTRVSLAIALIAALLDLCIGVSFGIISGLAGGKVDAFMQRILEILSGVPNLVVMILTLTIMKPGLSSIIVAMVITGWINMARIVRAQTLKVKSQEFVLAATALGESRVKIALKHILPNISSVIIVQMMFTIPAAMFFEAFLSFIGIGLTPPNSSLGILLNEGYKVFRYYPNLMWAPAITISLIMICFNLLADGLRDAFDPKMKD